MVVAEPLSVEACPAAAWLPDPESYLAQYVTRLRADGMLLGVIDPRSPSMDGMLCAKGIAREDLMRWCDAGFADDATFQQVAAGGSVTAPVGASPMMPVPMAQLMTASPASPLSGRIWLQVVLRSEPFTQADRVTASRLLREIQVAFDHVGEPGLGRLIISAHDQLIHADPASEARFLGEPEVLAHQAAEIRPVVAQRWPDLGPGEQHDLSIDFAGEPHWLRLLNGESTNGRPDHTTWYLEVRPLDESDVPPLGLVDDERIARAVAFLLDRFAEAPSLTDLASVVHTSPFHFHRLFTRQVGLSPKHFLLRRQLQMAKWLLRSTRTPIGEIATRTGFASHGHFTATFQRMIGKSPTAYRHDG